MDSYTPLLEKTRVPQPSLQKFAVISIFSKLRSAPDRLGPESQSGSEAISFCLTSDSPAVVDQSVRELCRLVSDSVLDISCGLLELQSALDGSDPKFVSLFVKGLGFLVRVEFGRKNGSWKFGSPENHPFVRILSCRAEAQTELLHQVLLFMMHNRRLGMLRVCDFLKSFLNFSILRVSSVDSASSLFVRQLISSIASLCCSFCHEAIPVFRLLMSCLKYVPCKNLDEVRNFNHIVDSLADAYTVALRDLVGTGSKATEVQLLGVELVETVLSLCASPHIQQRVGKEPIVEPLKHLLAVQKDLGLQYAPELSAAVLCLLVVLVKSDLEHEQLSVLKLLHFLLKWKNENGKNYGRDPGHQTEELLLIFPIINLMSSPSKSVKEAASCMLSILEKLLANLLSGPKVELSIKEGHSSLSKPGSIVFRFMQQLWFQDHHSSSNNLFLLDFASIGENEIEEMHCGPRSWASFLRVYSQRVSDRRTSSASDSCAQGIPLLIGAIAGVLVMHPSSANDGIDSLAAIGVMDPKMGVPLLLAVLFYSNILTRKDVTHQSVVPKLLGLLPLLASQSIMIPLVVQTIMQMLRKDMKAVLYATAIRLLCQTWEINDRAFSSLQGVLLPKGFIDFISERHICISMAASIRDVCRKNPDRGVDLILSVQACIENRDSTIQALGLESLSHLCEADVIDLYTAWDVIAKHVQHFTADSVLAHRWGAMDAETYPEYSKNLLNILWEVASSKQLVHDLQWTKARVSALQALAQFEVSYMEKSFPELKKDATELLFSEAKEEILKALEVLEIKIIMHEHTFRRRYVKEKKVPGSKIEKLLDVIPQVIFSAGKGRNSGELPGAALLCLSFNPKPVNNHAASRGFRDLHAQYEDAFKEVTLSLQLSRNIFIALTSLQSMKSFLRRWMRANILAIDALATDITSDKTSKAASDILKSLIRMAEESIPRSAENIALALGALCAVLPASAHTVKATASKFLLGWLFQYEHEHRQWTGAISLGLISSSLHVTDHKQKFQNISGLLEVLCSSKSILVKGACGVGLGFSCQDLLTRIEATENSNVDKETYRMQEERLLGRIVRLLSSILCQINQSSSDILASLSIHFPVRTEDIITKISQLSHENSDDFDDDVWGIAGLVIGLGMSLAAIYRAGKKDTVLKIKDLIISWIPHADSLIRKSASNSENKEIVLSVGSCLALPIVIAFCQKVELFDADEADRLVNGYKELISELLSVKKTGAVHRSLLMASCIGAGNFLACLLNEGIHPVGVESVECFLELFRKCYPGPHPPIVQFGGMLGVVNAMGAGTGNLVYSHPLPPSSHAGSEEKEISYVSGPLLASRVFTQHLTSSVQEIFLIAQNSKDLQLQQYAAWAISILRNYLWSKEQPNLTNDLQTDAARSKPILHSVSEDTMVVKLAQWLTNLNFSRTGRSLNIGSVATVLRCLSHAPRLPTLDWGAIIRRCMQHEAQIATSLSHDSSPKKGTLREECFRFSLAHANQFDELLTFLDELSDLSRFNTLEFNLQSCLLYHLADVMRIFSGSRIEKLFDDISHFITSLLSSQEYSSDQKNFLRISCWKGLYQCLDETSLDSLEYISKIEKCMEVLFAFLPASQSASAVSADQVNPVKEWLEAVKCLGRSRRDWLYEFLQVSNLDPRSENVQFREDVKKIQAKAKLARVGSIPFTELGRLKATILNCESLGMWDVIVEVVAALQNADGGVKRQWLVDAIEISCISSYPSTALLFIGLLSSSCCKYMPLLTADRSTVLNDIPVTITSLLSDPNWEIIAETFISYLWASMERIYGFATNRLDSGDDIPHTQPIDASERDKAAFLVQVMHHVCVAFKEYLPLDKQLKLAGMVVT